MHRDTIKILMIGDLFSNGGLLSIEKILPTLIKNENIDFTVVNAENVVGIGGITLRYAKRIFRQGVDVVTLGNHAYDNEDVFNIFKKKLPVIKPFNFAPKNNSIDCSDLGSIVIEKNNIKYGVLNAIGRVYLERLDSTNPFKDIKKELQKIKNKNADIILVDFHAEATAEKKAMGHFLDGEVNAVVCTHTHVQTSDNTILSNNTAYISDLGMSGPHDSVIGVKKSIIIKRFISDEHSRFVPSKKGYRVQGVIIEIDRESKISKSITRIDIPVELNN